MSEESKEIKVIDRRTAMEIESQGEDALTLAIKKGYDPAFIEKMMDLKDRHEKREAEKAYHEAMAKFKANPPKILKDKKAGFEAKGSKVDYSYADLATASELINRGLSNNGLSASWKTKQQNGNITVTCTITHELGHSESTSLSASPDTTGAKNSIQAIGSTISYLQRYTLFALTGLAAHGMDDDGISSEPAETIDDKQLITLNEMMEATDINKVTFLKSLKVKELKDLPAKDFKKAHSILKARASK